MSIRSAAAPDVLVVGAGPAGCVAALAHARAGASVLLIEAAPTASRRLAGEWLHPPAVEALRAAGIEPPADACAGRGFVVFPDDGGEPIVLPYAAGTGLSCEHAVLVTTLRDATAADARIRVVEGARLTGLAGGGLSVVSAAAGSGSVAPERIVGADGRSSTVRRLAGLEGRRRVVSHVAGLLLDDATLPFEGFGHLFLGGPGPVLAYRLGSGRIRLCIDVPGRPPAPRHAAAVLWDAYGSILPAELREPYRRALQARPPQWAAVGYRSRARSASHGTGRIVLVGDAAGECHPLTAVGMTLGFGDALAAAGTDRLERHRRERARAARVPELLAAALYEAFTRRDEGSAALRRGMYELWRDDAEERRRTVSLLSTEECGLGPFARSFSKVLGRALGGAAAQSAAGQQWRSAARRVGGLGWWLGHVAFARAAQGF